MMSMHTYSWEGERRVCGAGFSRMLTLNGWAWQLTSKQH
ncbi:hypothetical protein BC936DRAFT_149522 [Jimgerdemannia flammicorona]|uniref:Uncharacterized protein n=1 Tax=Jimgerdemannia flammicorona TaxID=994334 RepID=A0A433DNP4_9FUNG|nr:hypothetical protein BC936DRAFT_149522 [Jimgerdemannia flammicorona]